VWIKIGLRGFTPMQLVFLRLLLAAGPLLVICRIRGLRMPHEPVVWVHFAVAATVGNVMPFFLFGVGESSVDASLAAILNATTPLWTIAMALLARTERAMSASRVAGLLVGFAGTLVIFAPWRSGGSLSGAAACLGRPGQWNLPTLSEEPVRGPRPVPSRFVGGGVQPGIMIRSDRCSPNQRGEPVNSVGDLVDLGFISAFAVRKVAVRNAEQLPPTLPGCLPHHYRGSQPMDGGHDGS
jgi:hypothetical protein